ncbi:MAG TPA: FHA domain-containing serine/threonine-protein kinase [Gemmataceae bacterium]|jgi:pSer/pThr/pTyr-binding forkhead associated (FHA) protein
MVKRLLVIDREDQEHFFLSVEKGVMTIGGNSADAEAILRNLHISRIHCEVEVDEDLVVICNPESTSGPETNGAPLSQELHPGEAIHVGRSHFNLEGAAEAPAAEDTTVPELNVLSDFGDDILVEDAHEPAAAATHAAHAPASTHPHLVKQLFVIEGADRGRAFILPESGMIVIGKSKKNAEIILHDLFVSRAHCQIEVEDDSVLVTHLSGDNGTLINGQRITQQLLQIGDILRIGNEHLRLEIVESQESSSESEEVEEVVEVAEEEGEYEVEVVEEESDTEATKSIDATTADAKDPYSLPHPPVDKLLKLDGQVLGHFQVGPLLGRGQSSMVFRALDTKNQQLVALKVISPDFPANDAELQRFVKALKLLTPLQNPHLPTLCGAGKTGRYCWISREYVEGDSVARIVQRLNEGGSRFDWTRACRVAVHMGKALDFLHGKGITHGNITPRNVLIRKSDRLTKLADLMLSRSLEGSRLQKAILGKKLMAELTHIAPEQTDPHALGSLLGDIYALGTVLYFLLTGQPPFTGSSPREILAKVRDGKVERPSKLQRGIPAPFEAAVLLMMSRRPEERFPSAAEMLDAVQRIAEEHEVEL